jgi:putative addiction module CopG family antidote
MQLDLPPALDAFVKDLIARGHYADEADVVRDALRRMAEQDVDPETGASLAALRADLAAAEASGRSTASVTDVFERAAAKTRPARAP